MSKSNLCATLSDLARGLLKGNYDESLKQYRFWLKIGVTHGHIDDKFQVANDICRIMQPDLLKVEPGILTHPAFDLVTHFIRDIGADEAMSGQTFATIVGAFFEENLSLVRSKNPQGKSNFFLIRVNLIASLANLGYVEEDVLRDQILQSLISSPKLYDHQADALIVLFKLAGPTLEAIVDRSVVDRCFELLERHGPRENMMQDLIGLRGRCWEGLPPPFVFPSGRSRPIGVGREDYSGTVFAPPLGLPSTDPDPRISQPHPPESASAPETETTPVSRITQSHSISIASLLDFAITDPLADVAPADPTTITPHSTFYLEDGNIEVLCGDTLFRVHTSVLSFHSPVLRRMFARTYLATAESPNGCPRVLSSDAAADFAMLLTVVYLPEFPGRNNVPDFNTFSSLLHITEKYEMSTFRTRLLEVVRDAYPDTFDKVISTKPLGETFFSGPTPHPNEVLNLFVQHKLTFALPMAYYMVAWKGVDSFVDGRLPLSATLSPEILQTVIRGLMALRELEREEFHRLVLRPMTLHPCSSLSCTSLRTKDPRVSGAHQRLVDLIAGSSRPGTGVLQVLSLSSVCGDPNGFCESCLKGWEVEHVGVRKKAWDMLPKMFGLEG